MRNFIFLLGLLISYQSVGQVSPKKSIDSLEQILITAKDSARVDILNQLANLYYNVDMKQSLNLGEEALEIANSLAYYRGIQNAHQILRRVHRRLGNYSISIEYTLKTLPISEQLGDTAELLDSYTTLGNIYSSMENFEDAKKYLLHALSIGNKTNSLQLANIHNFLGRAYGKQGKYDSAEYSIQEALRREKSMPQPGYALSYIYNNLGEVYYYKKNYKKAIEYYRQSAALPENKRSVYGMTFTLNGLALVYKDLKQHDKAITLVTQSIEIAIANTFRDKSKEGYGILYTIYEQRKDYPNALFYYKKFNVYKDSIASEDRVQYIDNLKISYQTEKMFQENELLKIDALLKDSQLKQQFTLTWVAIATITFLLVISIQLYRHNIQRRKTNTILEKYSVELKLQVEDRTKELVNTNLELVSQNNQLEQFGYIIAHNLRGAVARILGLSNLIKGRPFDPSQDQQVIELIHTSTKELDTTIHDLNDILEIKKGLHNSYEAINFSERLKKVQSILKDKIEESETTIIEDFKTIETCYALPAYIESILYNLVSNAIKYRALHRKPVIQIKTSLAGDRIKLTVQDNGIGMELSRLKEKVFTLYQRFHHHVEGKGLGLFLVKTQVEALNGVIEIDSKVNEGTTFTVFLPLHGANLN